MYACFIFLVSITIWSAFCGSNDFVVNQFDTVAYYVFFAIFISTQLCFLIYVRYARAHERAKLKMGSVELEDHMTNHSICCKVCSSRGYDIPLVAKCTWQPDELLFVNRY